MDNEDTIRHSAVLRRKATTARNRSRVLHAEVVKVALDVADAQEAVADTLARVASQHPHHERRIPALSNAARLNAASERQWADVHSRPLMTEDGDAA
jgi:4-hydroxyphenylpyruvate dioxygenase-like putative hemolysin